MPLFETSRAGALTPGPHIIDIAQPTVIQGLALGRIGLLAQFDWGPVKSAYEPTSVGDFVKTYFPDGSGRTSTGWLATTRRKQAPWTPTRILGGSRGILPPTVPSCANVSLASTKIYKYVVVANNGTGHTQGSAWVRFALGCDDLTQANSGIVVTWPAVAGATSYDLYRTYAGGATTTAIGKVSANINGLTYTDVGALTTVNAVPPTTNTTGWVQAVTDVYTSTTALANNNTAGAAVARIVWKYPGSLPNSAGTVTTAAATNGDADSFNMTVALTNSQTGATSEKYLNLKPITTIALPTDTQGSRTTATTATVSGSYLVDQVLLLGTPAARPADGTWTPGGGYDGAAITASDYNDGLTALAALSNIIVVCADDCGDSIRTAVNANIATHVLAKTDRFGFLSSNRADSWATIKGSSGNGVGVQRHKLLKYFPWVNVRDINNVEQLSPAATFAATATANLDPREPDAWWNDKVTELFTGISSLDSSVYDPTDETIMGDATTLGVSLFVKLDNGRYAILHDRTTSLSVNERFGMTQKLRRHWARSLKSGLAPWTNGPNDAASQREVVRAMTRFFANESTLQRVAVATKATRSAYPMWAIGEAMYDINGDTGNTADSIAAGEYAVAANVITPSVMEKLFVLFNVGTGITIQ